MDAKERRYQETRSCGVVDMEEDGEDKLDREDI